MPKASESNISKKKKVGKGQEVISMKEMEKLYAADAKATLDKEPLAGFPVIKTRGKKFKVGDEVVKEPMMAIIVGTSRVNAYYEGDFDPDSPENPVCTAVGRVEDESKMAPPEGVLKPQHAQCNGCPQSAWGSADKGRGKACKNIRRVALIGAEDKSAEPTILTINIPPTGLKKFSAYVKRVAASTNRPLYGIISSISFDPDEDWPVPIADIQSLIDNPGLAMRAKKAAEIAERDILYVPLDTTPRVAEKPAAKKKSKSKRKF